MKIFKIASNFSKKLAQSSKLNVNELSSLIQLIKAKINNPELSNEEMSFYREMWIKLDVMVHDIPEDEAYEQVDLNLPHDTISPPPMEE